MLASSFYQLLKKLEGQGKRKEQYPFPHKAWRFICKNLVTVSCYTLVSQGRRTKEGTYRILTMTQTFPRIWTRSSMNVCWVLVLKTKVVKDPFFFHWKMHNRERKVSAVTERLVHPLSIFPPRNDPFMLWSELVTLMKKSKRNHRN